VARDARSLRALRGIVSALAVFTSCSSCLRGESPTGRRASGGQLLDWLYRQHPRGQRWHSGKIHV